MKRLILILSMAGTTGLAMARPIVNINSKAGKVYDNRAVMFANTCEPATQSADLDINNVRTKILNGGDMWWDLNNPKYEIPKVTDPNAVRKHSLFSGAIWIGGKDNGGNLKLAAMTYRQRGSDFWPGPLETTTSATDPTRCKAYDKMWKITRDELEDFENSNYSNISAGIRDWPGPDRTIKSGSEADAMAPYKEISDPTTYNPNIGEHPVLDDSRPASENGVDKQPDMFIWWVYNDKGNIHSETQGQPIGVECQTTAFAYSTNDEVNNMTFYTTKIINRGFTTLSDCYMGEWVDADLGNYADDYVGCDVGRSLGYCYNGDDNDEGVLGYGLNPPSVGVDYFEGPTNDSGNQMGLSHFMYYNNDNDPDRGNPEVANEFYNLLQGKWLRGQNVTYGGNGFGGSRPCKYMFPANTDPEFPNECWDEKSAGNPAADRRFLQSTGPFKLLPGTVQKITIGVVWARTTSGGAGAPCLGTGSLGLLQLASDKAQTLFNNKFKILDGPNAPDVEIQELEQQLVLKMLNTQSDKVENYTEQYKNANNEIKTYKFEGYLVYQLKDGTVNTGDLENVDKARLLYQCDLYNNRDQIINRVFDPKLNALIPVEKVDGANKGLQHSLNITRDLFATTGNTDLVNFKTYYYMVLSYSIISDDPQQTDPNQFLAGRRNIKVYKGIPHKTEPEQNGTILNSGYGSGPMLKRIEGRGNGGNVLEFSDETIKEILANNWSANPVYLGGQGPVKVKVVDPLKVPKAEFELYVRENKASVVKGLKDSMTGNANWVLVNKTTGDSIFSDAIIRNQFESVQGVRAASNPTKQTLADWGLSIEWTQVTNPGENTLGEPTNGLVSWSVEWEDNGKQWLTAIADNNSVATATAPQKWPNWIRSGQNGRNSTFDPYIHSFFKVSPNDTAFDPTGAYEGIWNGRIGPYALAARAEYSAATGNNTYGPAWVTSGLQDNPLSELASIELVITPDKSKWSRCPIFEAADHEVKGLTEGGMDKLNMRWGKSKDKNGADQGGQGLGYFPGYAINKETGERLVIAFSEDSYLEGENGRDMLWNPTSTVYNDNGNYPVIGGKHFIYIFGTGYSMVTRAVKGERYLGEDDANFQRFRDACLPGAAGGIANLFEKRRLFSQCMWVIPTYMVAGYNMNDGVPPTWVKFNINVKKAYTTYSTGSARNNDRPFYTFSTNEIAPSVSNENGKKSLDLVNVVPNPYRAYSQYETSPIDSRVKITNLPPECTVSIFDMGGNLIRRINKADENTFVDWDLKNNNNVPISSGLYLIHVKSKDLGEKIIRWYGIMHSIDLDTY
ncbi:MAG: hypothetical protein KG003_10645 [Bacteroidetes bacterium]|nr:hypothetical protein [Bacteroidota bacterium]